MKVLSPGVQHAEEADLGAEVLGVGGDLQQRRRRWCGTADRRAVFLFCRTSAISVVRQREDDVEVRDGQQLLCLRCASHLSRALVWHFGQCRFRHEL